VEVYVGLGSNLGHERANLRAGLDDLVRHGLPLRALSSVWETEPVGTPHPAPFLNMVLGTRTEIAPLELLDLLLETERRAGRVRGERNGPRVLDLDLLLMGDLQLNESRLRIPHPRMWQRRFVLEPLAEIAPDLVNPTTGRTVAEECRRLGPRPRVRRLGPLAP
jgi:2-amino-4-hydroxy-6-hydroxymethyldihydropteridine diphosphokinase